MVAPVKVAPERILGSGKGPGLVFKNAPSQRTLDTSGTSSKIDLQDSPEVAEVEQSMSLPFTPASVRKGKANVSLEGSSSEKAQDPSSSAIADIFSLSASNHFLIHLRRQTFSPPESAKPSFASITTQKGATSSLSISSAPKIEEYIPPEPTSNDPYPGYYQLPSGTWEAYDPTYYQRFYNKWKTDYDREVRALEKKEKGFEDVDNDDTQEIDALSEMEKAKKEVQEREEKKALTQGAGGEPAGPRMNIKVRSLHLRLSALSC